MASARSRLEGAYRATTYRVAAGRVRIDLRIGQRAAALDRLLHRAGIRECALLTACNPASRPLPAWRNRVRQVRLWRLLRGARLRLPALGVPDRGGWAPEASVLAGPLPRGRARRLGRRFGQNAVVAARRGRPCVLVWSV